MECETGPSRIKLFLQVSAKTLPSKNGIHTKKNLIWRARHPVNLKMGMGRPGPGLGPGPMAPRSVCEAMGRPISSENYGLADPLGIWGRPKIKMRKSMNLVSTIWRPGRPRRAGQVEKEEESDQDDELDGDRDDEREARAGRTPAAAEMLGGAVWTSRWLFLVHVLVHVKINPPACLCTGASPTIDPVCSASYVRVFRLSNPSAREHIIDFFRKYTTSRGGGQRQQRWSGDWVDPSDPSGRTGPTPLTHISIEANPLGPLAMNFWAGSVTQRVDPARSHPEVNLNWNPTYDREEVWWRTSGQAQVLKQGGEHESFNGIYRTDNKYVHHVVEQMELTCAHIMRTNRK